MEKSKKAIKSITETLIAIIVAFLAVAIIQQLLFLPVGIQGPSMEPTINSSGDTAYIQRKGYKLEINDIIVFYRPLNDEAYNLENPAEAKVSIGDFFSNFLHLKNSIDVDNSATTADGNFICVIKRVIGLPGDTVEIKNNILYRNDEEVEDFPMTNLTDVPKLTVEENKYFVLGDNRDLSYDSEDYYKDYYKFYTEVEGDESEVAEAKAQSICCIEKDWILGEVLMIISRGGTFGVKFV